MPDLGSVTMAEFLGQESQGFLKQLVDANLDESSRKFIVGEYIREKVGKSLRSFALSAGSRVEPADAHCVPAFTPTFTHREWKDGEDLVVAEGISGFNVRFNAIRSDLDGIKADLATAFACVGSLQKAVAGALVEITAELNAVNRQIYDCCAKSDDGIMVAPPYRGPRIVDMLPGYDLGRAMAGYGPPIDALGTRYQPMTGYPVGELQPRFAQPKVWRDASDANKGMIAGMEASRIDVTTLNGKTMDVWKTGLGLILVDASETPETAKPGFVPVELERSREFARYLADNDADVKEAFPNGFTAREFTDKYGATRLAGGTPVADLMKGLPDDMAFDAPAKLADAVTDATVRAVADAGLSQVTVVGAIGLNAGVEVAAVSLDSVKFVDDKTTEALKNAGIKTLGDLSGADPARLRDTLEGAGIRTSIGDAAGLRGLGRAITRVGRGADR